MASVLLNTADTRPSLGSTSTIPTGLGKRKLVQIRTPSEQESTTPAQHHDLCAIGFPHQRMPGYDVIMLNSDLPACAEEVWTSGQPGTRICTDGAADRLYRLFCPSKTLSHLDWADGFQRHPDLVIGDLDSVQHETRHFYETYVGCKVVEVDDQNSTDFTKALRWLQTSIGQGKDRKTIVLGGLNGRLDQTLSTLQALTDESLTKLEIVVLDEGNIVMMLRPGRHRISTKDGQSSRVRLGPHCGLFPYSSMPVKTISKGLEWCMDGSQPMSLAPGGLISTNNRVTDENGVIEVDCDGNVLFSIEYTYEPLV